MPSGRRLLSALGLWLFASAAAGGLTFAASRGQPRAAIIIAEVYALLVGALMVAFRTSLRDSLALQPCTTRDVAFGATCLTAYALVGPVQAIVAPDAFSDLLVILLGMGSDDGRLATAAPLMIGVIILRACVVAPVGEELLFRGAFHAWLRRRLPALATIPITAACWSLIHGFAAILPLAFVMGLAFAWVRERTGSTIPTAIAHAVHNVVMVGVSYALTDWTTRLPPWTLS